MSEIRKIFLAVQALKLKLGTSLAPLILSAISNARAVDWLELVGSDNFEWG